MKGSEFGQELRAMVEVMIGPERIWVPECGPEDGISDTAPTYDDGSTGYVREDIYNELSTRFGIINGRLRAAVTEVDRLRAKLDGAGIIR